VLATAWSALLLRRWQDRSVFDAPNTGAQQALLAASCGYFLADAGAYLLPRREALWLVHHAATLGLLGSSLLLRRGALPAAFGLFMGERLRDGGTAPKSEVGSREEPRLRPGRSRARRAACHCSTGCPDTAAPPCCAAPPPTRRRVHKPPLPCLPHDGAVPAGSRPQDAGLVRALVGAVH
jgi:hypothetical protein